MTRIDAATILKRWLKEAGLPDAFSANSLRATGITN